MTTERKKSGSEVVNKVAMAMILGPLRSQRDPNTIRHSAVAAKVSEPPSAISPSLSSRESRNGTVSAAGAKEVNMAMQNDAHAA